LIYIVVHDRFPVAPPIILILTLSFKPIINLAPIDVILKAKQIALIELGLTLSAVIFPQIINYKMMIVDYKERYVHQILLI
jgi:hypothetical protein